MLLPPTTLRPLARTAGLRLAALAAVLAAALVAAAPARAQSYVQEARAVASLRVSVVR